MPSLAFGKEAQWGQRFYQVVKAQKCSLWLFLFIESNNATILSSQAVAHNLQKQCGAIKHDILEQKLSNMEEIQYWLKEKKIHIIGI